MADPASDFTPGPESNLEGTASDEAAGSLPPETTTDCMSCGTPGIPGTTCRVCGVAISSGASVPVDGGEAQEQATAVRFCPSCTSEVAAHASTCMVCGAQLPRARSKSVKKRRHKDRDQPTNTDGKVAGRHRRHSRHSKASRSRASASVGNVSLRSSPTGTAAAHEAPGAGGNSWALPASPLLGQSPAQPRPEPELASSSQHVYVPTSSPADRSDGTRLASANQSMASASDPRRSSTSDTAALIAEFRPVQDATRQRAGTTLRDPVVAFSSPLARPAASDFDVFALNEAGDSAAELEEDATCDRCGAVAHARDGEFCCVCGGIMASSAGGGARGERGSSAHSPSDAQQRAEEDKAARVAAALETICSGCGAASAPRRECSVCGTYVPPSETLFRLASVLVTEGTRAFYFRQWSQRVAAKLEKRRFRAAVIAKRLHLDEQDAACGGCGTASAGARGGLCFCCGIPIPPFRNAAQLAATRAVLEALLATTPFGQLKDCFLLWRRWRDLRRTPAVPKFSRRANVGSASGPAASAQQRQASTSRAADAFALLHQPSPSLPADRAGFSPLKSAANSKTSNDVLHPEDGARRLRSSSPQHNYAPDPGLGEPSSAYTCGSCGAIGYNAPSGFVPSHCRVCGDALAAESESEPPKSGAPKEAPSASARAAAADLVRGLRSGASPSAALESLSSAPPEHVDALFDALSSRRSMQQPREIRDTSDFGPPLPVVPASSAAESNDDLSLEFTAALTADVAYEMPEPAVVSSRFISASAIVRVESAARGVIIAREAAAFAKLLIFEKKVRNKILSEVSSSYLGLPRLGGPLVPAEVTTENSAFANLCIIGGQEIDFGQSVAATANARLQCPSCGGGMDRYGEQVSQSPLRHELSYLEEELKAITGEINVDESTAPNSGAMGQSTTYHQPLPPSKISKIVHSSISACEEILGDAKADAAAYAVLISRLASEGLSRDGVLIIPRDDDDDDGGGDIITGITESLSARVPAARESVERCRVLTKLLGAATGYTLPLPEYKNPLYALPPCVCDAGRGDDSSVPRVELRIS